MDEGRAARSGGRPHPRRDRAFDITDKNGNVIVEKDKRITARHVRQLEQSRARSSSACRKTSWSAAWWRNDHRRPTPARSSPRPTTSTEALLKKLRAPASRNCPACTPTNSDTALHLQTLASDETADQLRGPARGHLPHDAPGEPPTEDAAEALFQPLFFNGRHLRPVARRPHEVQRRVGRDTPEGAMTLSNEDILDVVKILVEMRNGRGEWTTSTTSATAACVRRRAGREPVPRRACPRRAAVKERLGHGRGPRP